MSELTMSKEGLNRNVEIECENSSVITNDDNLNAETGLSLNAEADLTTAEGTCDSVKRKSRKKYKKSKKHKLNKIKKHKKKKSKRSSSLSSASTEYYIPYESANTVERRTFRRNFRGESKLHIACAQNDGNELGLLLTDCLMSPNIKDYAGWTPMHIAVMYGYQDILESLLGWSGNVNAPGFEYETPLHTAFRCSKFNIAEYLIKYGADKNCINIFGESPECLNPEKWSELSKIEPIYSFPDIILDSMPPYLAQYGTMLPAIYLSNVSIDKGTLKKFFWLFSKKHIKHIVNGDYGKLTHIIVPETENKTCEVNFDCLSGVANGLKILTQNWITDSLQKNKLLAHEDYSIKGTESFVVCDGFLKSRISKTLAHPKLFDGVNIHISGNKGWERFSFEELKKLVVNFGAKLLTRMPKPDMCPNNIIPYHFRRNKTMYRVSNIVLYITDSDDLVKYDLEHLKTFHISWFIESAQKFIIL